MMKIDSVNNYNPNFNAGLTKQMVADISMCDVQKVEHFLGRKGINTDFKNNKVIAWCALKCYQLINEVNKKCNLNIGMPNGIYTEDFSKLNGVIEKAVGATNFLPSNLYKGHNKVVPEKTIFFNIKEINWENVDEMADKNFEVGINATDFFLEPFIHECMHVFHEDKLLKNLSVSEFLVFLRYLQVQNVVENYQAKYSGIFSKLCDYGASHPIETIACDLSKRFIDSLDKQKLDINKNFFEYSPYNQRLISENKEENTKNKVLRQIWDGTLVV